MKCNACGHENMENAAFCSGCGKKLEIDNKCPQCGFDNQPGAVFCSGCGGKIERMAPPAATTPTEPLARNEQQPYTPPRPQTPPAQKPTGKAMPKKPILAIIAVVCVIGVVVAFGIRAVREIWPIDPTIAVDTTPTAVSERIKKASGKTNEDRIGFITSFGWEVEVDPAEIMEIIIPEEFDEVYLQYNNIQKAQGYNLEDYAGKRCKRYAYNVTNYPGTDQPIRANLLIYKNKVIGGDICSLDANGFIHGFEAPAYEGSAGATFADQFREAVALYEAGAPDAQAAMEAVFIAYPQEPQLYSFLADEYEIRGDTDVALSILRYGYEITESQTLRDRFDSLVIEHDLGENSDEVLAALQFAKQLADLTGKGEDFDKGKNIGKEIYDAMNSIRFGS